jgi:hypothetical protein
MHLICEIQNFNAFISSLQVCEFQVKLWEFTIIASILKIKERCMLGCPCSSAGFLVLHFFITQREKEKRASKTFGILLKEIKPILQIVIHIFHHPFGIIF